MAIAISVLISIIMVHNGFKEIDPNKQKLIRTKVILPASVPTMIVGIKTKTFYSLMNSGIEGFLMKVNRLGQEIAFQNRIIIMRLTLWLIPFL